MTKRILAFGGLTVLFFTFGNLFKVSAYEIEQLDVFDEERFELGPTLFQITAKRGESFTKTLQLTNRSGDEQEYMIYTLDFEGSDDPLQFTKILEDIESEYGASGWFILEVEKIYLDHGERLFFDVEIEIPESADAGEHYAMVLVEPSEPGIIQNGGSIVNIQSRVGSLFLLNVEGKRTKRADLDQFFMDDTFFENTPIPFYVDVVNTGSVHVAPSGRVEIHDWFGRKVDELTIDEFIVLRDSVRRKSVTWDRKFAIGKYSAKLFLDLDLGESEVTAEFEFWVVPWKLILVVLAAIIFIAVLLRYLLLKVRIEVKLR